ncbi:hypothetical protein [Paenibacillus elgii]|uniref:hypothetical protein n=1 Tax=Paenibacillus elgii TaxID=189691 RepID=UPI0013D03DB3|nr:hypothetical protein [Paenibacillus elgii]
MAPRHVLLLESRIDLQAAGCSVASRSVPADLLLGATTWPEWTPAACAASSTSPLFGLSASWAAAV